MRVPRLRATLLATFGALLALGAAAAPAAEQTRESYTDAVEPICKVNSQASDRILGPVKAEVKADKLKPAAARFTKAAAALKKTLNQLRAVPQPSGDEAKLTKWLGYMKTEVEQFEATAAKLRAGQKGAAVAMTVKLTRTANLANSQVLIFSFRYCRADTSKYA